MIARWYACNSHSKYGQWLPLVMVTVRSQSRSWSRTVCLDRQAVDACVSTTCDSNQTANWASQPEPWNNPNHDCDHNICASQTGHHDACALAAETTWTPQFESSNQGLPRPKNGLHIMYISACAYLQSCNARTTCQWHATQPNWEEPMLSEMSPMLQGVTISVWDGDRDRDRLL
jgi:hypothetical protein